VENCAKDELAIRPVWHQKEDRVWSHMLICFLAHAMRTTLLHRLGLARPRWLKRLNGNVVKDVLA
jgi:hypothetical protein